MYNKKKKKKLEEREKKALLQHLRTYPFSKTTLLKLQTPGV